MRIRYLNDKLFGLIQQHIDQNVVKKDGDHLELKFPQNFIEMGELIDISSPKAVEIVKNHLSKNIATHSARMDISPSFEDHLRNKWMSLSSVEHDTEITIDQTLEYYRCHYGASHFTITKVNESVEFFHRLPRMQLLLEECQGDTEKFSEKSSQLLVNQSGEWLLPSIFDLMTYPLIYTIFKTFHLAIPLHAHNSRLSLYFFRDYGFKTPYWEEQGVMGKFYPDRMDHSSKDADFLLGVLGNNLAIQNYDHIKNSFDYLNKLLAYIYDWNNWLDTKEYCLFENNLKAISLFHLIISSISYNKFITNDFVKLANTFRSLDLLSNLIVALSLNKNKKHNEDIAFNRLFDFEELIQSKNIFYGCNHFNVLCKKVSSSIKTFNDNHSTEDFCIFKEFRNHFTHGTFDPKEKRFKSLMKCPLPPHEINFMPILWLAILGASPDSSLEFFHSS